MGGLRREVRGGRILAATLRRFQWASARRVAELVKELARAQVRLKRAEALLDLQKKYRTCVSNA
ncbi:hypothetical protein D7Y13_24595 [Corallococcus praedator]|uniref:Uncharacterized protein n=1 Tax=Corallococcus praedator TaxID=2316724 RepID=A0ABX9QDZ9_9BACT|nr:hypothetical protein D7X74_17340 [Corallococcus sp. CA047B]RKH28562.1 hypothetical protein D7X75_24515 [Corallococcus sp. CA031C]RKI02453.1 hypothetical protein D7Y13_24595 [Corallococcus praedator]